MQIEIRSVRVQQTRPCAKFEFSPAGGQRPARYDLAWLEPFSAPKREQWGTRFVPKDVVYALFPFQGEKPKETLPDCPPEKAPANYLPGGDFTLRMRFPAALQGDVERAVWAWVNFGGLGARTRRGCGALDCAELAPKGVAELPQWFREGAGAAAAVQREWPTLSQRMLYYNEMDGPMQAWDYIIGRLKFFRQGEKFARDPGSPPSRSRYPEPDTIRRITQLASQGHQPRRNVPDGFPRAEFGLPIIFHFKDENAGDPFETALFPFLPAKSGGPALDKEGNAIGETRDRMASPLVLRPLALGNGRTVPIILPLGSPSVAQVELQDNKSKECLTRRRAVPVRTAPLPRATRRLRAVPSAVRPSRHFWPSP